MKTEIITEDHQVPIFDSALLNLVSPCWMKINVA